MTAGPPAQRAESSGDPDAFARRGDAERGAAVAPQRENLPWRRREVYEHAICSFLRPGDPDSVTLADADRFCRSPQWPKLYAALEAAFACVEQKPWRVLPEKSSP